MRMKRLGAVGALVATGLVLGYLFGPPLVIAASNAPTTTSDVHIKDDTNSYKANVTSKHRLSVDTEADLTTLGSDDFLDTFGLQYQQPNGNNVLARGTGSFTIPACGVIAGVLVDGASPETVTLKEGSSVDWQGTLAGAGHLNDTFDGGLVFFSNISVTTTGTDQWIVYGYPFSCSGGSAGLHAQGRTK